MLHVAKQLREKRANIAKTIEANLKALEKADEARKQELLTANDAAFTEAQDLKRQIDQIERKADLESELDSAGHEDRQQHRGDSNDPKERAQQTKLAVEAFLRAGYDGLSDEARAILVPSSPSMYANINGAVAELRKMFRDGEKRDLATTTSGIVIPREYWNELEMSMLEFGGMREASRVIRTGSGAQLTFPTVNDTANSATLVTEATQTTTSVDATFSSMSLDAFTYRSFSLIAREFMQDWQFDVEAEIRRQLAERLARGLNKAFTTDDGSSKPNGLMIATSSGFTLASGNSVAYKDFTGIEHALDPSYRRRPSTRWMFHDSVLQSAKELLDSQNRPIWLPGLAVRAVDTILGYPFTVNQDIAKLDSGGDKVIAFGDFSKYLIRDVVGGDAGAVILRLNERYADFGQVGFFLFSRHDGDLLDAGTDPIKHAVTPSP